MNYDPLDWKLTNDWIFTYFVEILWLKEWTLKGEIIIKSHNDLRMNTNRVKNAPKKRIFWHFLGPFKEEKETLSVESQHLWVVFQMFKKAFNVALHLQPSIHQNNWFFTVEIGLLLFFSKSLFSFLLGFFFFGFSLEIDTNLTRDSWVNERSIKSLCFIRLLNFEGIKKEKNLIY